MGDTNKVNDLQDAPAVVHEFQKGVKHREVVNFGDWKLRSRARLASIGVVRNISVRKVGAVVRDSNLLVGRLKRTSDNININI